MEHPAEWRRTGQSSNGARGGLVMKMCHTEWRCAGHPSDDDVPHGVAMCGGIRVTMERPAKWRCAELPSDEDVSRRVMMRGAAE